MKAIISVGLLLSCINAFAEAQFIEGKKCGSAKLVKFVSCENNSIELNFEDALSSQDHS